MRGLTLSEARVVNLGTRGGIADFTLLVAFVQRTITIVDGMTKVGDFFALGRAIGATIGVAAVRWGTARTRRVIVVVTATRDGEK